MLGLSWLLVEWVKNEAGLLGSSKKTDLPDDTKRHIAIHEAGHAITGWLVKGLEPPQRVMTPRLWMIFFSDIYWSDLILAVYNALCWPKSYLWSIQSGMLSNYLYKRPIGRSDHANHGGESSWASLTGNFHFSMRQRSRGGEQTRIGSSKMARMNDPQSRHL